MPSRRRFLQLAALTGGLAGCSSAPQPRHPGSASPRDTTTPSATAARSETPADSTSVPRRWARALDHSNSTKPTLAPGPDGPAVYLATEPGKSTETEQYTLYALGLQDGEVGWRTSLPEPLQYGPAVKGDRVYIATGRQSLHGKAFAVRALDRHTGEQVWSFDTEDRRILYPLDATQETVFIGRRDDQIGPRGEALYALAAEDGHERWQVESGDAMSGRHYRGTFFVESYGGLVALDPSNGERRWRLETKRSFEGPVYGDEAVFVDSDGAVRAHGFEAGETLWRRSFDFTLSGLVQPVGALGHHVYAGDYDGRLLALLPTSGGTNWTLSVDSDQFRPTVSRFSDRLYVAGAGVRSVDPVSGEVDWTFTSDGEGYLGVQPGPETVFAEASRAGELYALDPGRGDVRWTYRPDAYAGTVTAGNTAFTVAGGTVYALNGYPDEQ